jgi:hypothetical protein
MPRARLISTGPAFGAAVRAAAEALAKAGAPVPKLRDDLNVSAILRIALLVLHHLPPAELAGAEPPGPERGARKTMVAGLERAEASAVAALEGAGAGVPQRRGKLNRNALLRLALHLVPRAEPGVLQAAAAEAVQQEHEALVTRTLHRVGVAPGPTVRRLRRTRNRGSGGSP